MLCVKLSVLLALSDNVFSLLRTHENPCPKLLTIDISDGKLFRNKSILKNDTIFDRKNYYIDDQGKILGCICNIKPCLRKCCGPNEQLIERKCVETKLNLGVQLYEGIQKTYSLDNYHYIYNKECKLGATLLIPHYEASEAFYLQKNGSLYLPNFNHKPMRELQDYCIDRFDIEDLEMKGMISGLLCILNDDSLGEKIPVFKYIGKFKKCSE